MKYEPPAAPVECQTHGRSRTSARHPRTALPEWRSRVVRASGVGKIGGFFSQPAWRPASSSALGDQFSRNARVGDHHGQSDLCDRSGWQRCPHGSRPILALVGRAPWRFRSGELLRPSIGGFRRRGPFGRRFDRRGRPQDDRAILAIETEVSRTMIRSGVPSRVERSGGRSLGAFDEIDRTDDVPQSAVG